LLRTAGRLRENNRKSIVVSDGFATIYCNIKMNGDIINLFGAINISSGVAPGKDEMIDSTEIKIEKEVEVDAGEKSTTTNNMIVNEENENTMCYHDIMTPEYESNDTRVAMIGNVDSGKSTLIGVLTNATLDDGRGAARSLVLKHRHEQENGRTSAVTVEIMGYKGMCDVRYLAGLLAFKFLIFNL
jgi:GTPase